MLVSTLRSGFCILFFRILDRGVLELLWRAYDRDLLYPLDEGLGGYGGWDVLLWIDWTCSVVVVRRVIV